MVCNPKNEGLTQNKFFWLVHWWCTSNAGSTSRPMHQTDRS